MSSINSSSFSIAISVGVGLYKTVVTNLLRYLCVTPNICIESRVIAKRKKKREGNRKKKKKKKKRRRE